MTAAPALDPGDDWRGLPPDQKALYAERLAVACARVGIGLGDAAMPGELARRLDREFVSRAHLRLIDATLARMLAARQAGEPGMRVMINTPPQVGKSSLAGEWCPFWWLSHRPRDRVIVGSYADALARRRGRRVRQYVREHGLAYGLELDPEYASVNDWLLTCGGGMRSTGVGGSLTGIPGDLGVIDDPHKDRAEADSAEIRENVWDWYSSTFSTRLSPGAPLLVIMTPWHPDDLRGRLIKAEGTVDEGGRWVVITLPAFAGTDDPLGREPGDPLPHPKIAEGGVEAARAHWEEKRRTSTPRDWAALFMCDPIDASGALLTAEQLDAAYNPRPVVEPQIVAVAVDPSGGGRDEAGVVGGFRGDDGACYWTHDRSGRMTAEQWGRAACELAAEIDADRIIFEGNYGKDMARLTIRTSWEALAREWAERRPGEPNPYADRLPPRIVEVHSKRGKLLRAEPVAAQVVEARVFMTARMPELVGQWLTWRPTSSLSPGRIDASVHLTLALLRPPGTDTVVSSPKGGPSGKSPIHRRRIDRG
ncbi:terminase family protein [Microbispora sp. RL4-1S]|uniref:Terminase family protein n=1 Tax=Microbispora oryzae TaxID=2806554 RepID=A0A941AI66_9ACTN|nr:terminase family protein [Microbispora oryzae]MBP2703497.1 terminase family protein [Microbispora oryzae]